MGRALVRGTLRLWCKYRFVYIIEMEKAVVVQVSYMNLQRSFFLGNILTFLKNNEALPHPRKVCTTVMSRVRHNFSHFVGFIYRFFHLSCGGSCCTKCCGSCGERPVFGVCKNSVDWSLNRNLFKKINIHITFPWTVHPLCLLNVDFFHPQPF